MFKQKNQIDGMAHVQYVRKMLLINMASRFHNPRSNSLSSISGMPFWIFDEDFIWINNRGQIK